MMTMMIIATTMTTPPAAAEDATALTEPAVVSEVVAMKQSRIKQDSNNTTVNEHSNMAAIYKRPQEFV